MKINRFLYPWCLLICTIFLSSSLQNARSAYQYIADYDSSRWIHFLVYAMVVALPVGTWQRRESIFLSFVPPILSIVLEALQAGFPLSLLRTQTVPADLFGIAAGILLGLNIRTIRNAARPLSKAELESPPPAVS
jgi:putative effector of murein hydrolase